MVLTGSLFFFFLSPRTISRLFFVHKNCFVFFSSSSRYIDFNTHGDDGARTGAWDTGSHTVVLSPLDKLGIVGGSPLSTGL